MVWVLGAWRLVLVACCLQLAASSRYPFSLAHCSWSSAISLELVFCVDDIRDAPVPAGTAALTLAALIGRRACFRAG